MPEFGNRSLINLASCHPVLQKLFHSVVLEFDCTILCGHRNEQQQHDLYNAHPPRTQVQWPNSKHNELPSKAVDAVPYPIDWQDRERMTYFAGFVKGVALGMGIEVRWGGDWDGDTEVDGNRFDDLPHFELKL